MSGLVASFRCLPACAWVTSVLFQSGVQHLLNLYLLKQYGRPLPELGLTLIFFVSCFLVVGEIGKWDIYILCPCAVICKDRDVYIQVEPEITVSS